MSISQEMSHDRQAAARLALDLLRQLRWRLSLLLAEQPDGPAAAAAVRRLLGDPLAARLAAAAAGLPAIAPGAWRLEERAAHARLCQDTARRLQLQAAALLDLDPDSPSAIHARRRLLGEPLANRLEAAAAPPPRSQR